MRVFLLSLMLTSFAVSAQLEIDSAKVAQLQKFEFGGLYRSTISGNLGGVTGLIGPSYDVLLSSHWQFEAGFGFPAVGFGFKCFPQAVEREKWRFSIGQKSMLAFPLNTFSAQFYHSLNLGCSWFLRARWNLSLEGGLAYVHDTQSFDYIPGNNQPLQFAFAFKAGYRFSFRVMKRRKEIEAENAQKNR